MIDDLLTEDEKSLVNTFCRNQKMYNAVKKVALAGIYQNGVLSKESEKHEPMRNWALHIVNNKELLSNEHMGAELRAAASGLNFLESAFNRMLEYTLEADKPKKAKNPAV